MTKSDQISTVKATQMTPNGVDEGHIPITGWHPGENLQRVTIKVENDSAKGSWSYANGIPSS